MKKRKFIFIVPDIFTTISYFAQHYFALVNTYSSKVSFFCLFCGKQH